MIDFVDSMLLAGKQANRLGKPVVLAPVATGETQLRRDTARRLLNELHFSAIRGNASEICFLAGEQSAGSGVDVSAVDATFRTDLIDAVFNLTETQLREGIRYEFL